MGKRDKTSRAGVERKKEREGTKTGKERSKIAVAVGPAIGCMNAFFPGLLPEQEGKQEKA